MKAARSRKAGPTESITAGVIHGKTQGCQHREVVEPLFHRVARGVLGDHIRDDDLRRLLQVHVIGRLLLFGLSAGKQFFSLGGSDDDAEPTRLLTDDTRGYRTSTRPTISPGPRYQPSICHPPAPDPLQLLRGDGVCPSFFPGAFGSPASRPYPAGPRLLLWFWVGPALLRPD